MKTTHRVLGAALALAAITAGCTAASRHEAGSGDVQARATALMKQSFKPHGQAQLDRIEQDDVQRTCSRYHGDQPVPKDVAAKIEKAQLATIKYPADGQLLGDWKEGEKVAQSGRGKQFNDDPAKPSGGNCYACHQLSPKEIAYGTIGPSLLHYGKLRGNTPEMQKYTYGKIFNSDAFSACSNMPRFGHNAILTEKQMKDVTALLLDPKSPVNQ